MSPKIICDGAIHGTATKLVRIETDEPMIFHVAIIGDDTYIYIPEYRKCRIVDLEDDDANRSTN